MEPPGLIICFPDSNIKKSPSESLLTSHLIAANVETVRFLISQLRADVNLELKNRPDSEFCFYPIHLAIWHDFLG